MGLFLLLPGWFVILAIAGIYHSRVYGCGFLERLRTRGVKGAIQDLRRDDSPGEYELTMTEAEADALVDGGDAA